MAHSAHRTPKKEQLATAQRAVIVESLADGCSRAAACQAAGVPRRTFYHGLSEDEAFRGRVEEAEVQSVKMMESVVYVAGLKSVTIPKCLLVDV